MNNQKQKEKKSKPAHVTLPISVMEIAKQQSKELGLSFSGYLRMLIMKDMAEKNLKGTL